MLYIDQPVGAGYSYGTTRTGTSLQAAQTFYAALQLLLKDPKFSKYATRDWALTTESYGGHYGPVFSQYILSQNAAGKGITIPLKTLIIGNGLTVPEAQYPQYITYAKSNPQVIPRSF